MKAKSLVRKAVVGIALVCISAGYVWADKLQLQAKLSKEVKIELRDVTIAEALEQIGKRAGVKFVLSDEAVWKLPQGEATRLSVMLDGPLAESTTEMLNAFFMRYAVGDEEITIYPRPELDHILGRPTAKQLELLKAIYTRTTRKYWNSRKFVSDCLGQEVLVMPVKSYNNFYNFMRQLTVEVTAADGTRTQELAVPLTIAQLLGSIKADWSWYISGMDFPNQTPEIRVVDQQAFRNAKLDQVVDISFEDEKAEMILRRLSQWTGMEFIVDAKAPSWLSERISVDMQNISLRQAIRNIAATVDGYAGINVEENEIVIEGPIHEKKPAVPKAAQYGPAGGQGYVGKISIPMEGGKYYIEFMLREKDLTEELKKLWQDKMKEILKVPSLYELAPAGEPQPTDKTQKMEQVY